jgi:hypothetical protein
MLNNISHIISDTAKFVRRTLHENKLNTDIQYNYTRIYVIPRLALPEMMELSDDSGGGKRKDKMASTTKVLRNKPDMTQKSSGESTEGTGGFWGKSKHLTEADANVFTSDEESQQRHGTLETTQPSTKLGRGGGASINAGNQFKDRLGSIRWSDLESDDSEDDEKMEREDEMEDSEDGTDDSYGYGIAATQKGIKETEKVIKTLENLDRSAMTEEEKKEHEEILKEAHNTLKKGILKLERESKDMAVDSEREDSSMEEPNITGKRRTREFSEHLDNEEETEWIIAGKKKNKNKVRQSTLSEIAKAGGITKKDTTPRNDKKSIQSSMLKYTATGGSGAFLNKPTTAKTSQTLETGELEKTKTMEKKNQTEQPKKDTTSKPMSSLKKYSEAAKIKTNKNFIRVNFSFKVFQNNSSEWRRVAKIILDQANEIDTEAKIVSWHEGEEITATPITAEMLENTRVRNDEIARYFDRKGNLIPGSTYFQAGVKITTNADIRTFINKWNQRKNARRAEGKDTINIVRSAMQHSARAYVVGIAVGSGEGQDFDELNDRLQDSTGIQGIEISYQNIYQAGITNEFWDIANKQAKKTGYEQNSREFLSCKYAWAPSALVIYVPDSDKVTQARKTLIEKYGKLEDGKSPMWPDGTRMRFLPIKGTPLKSEKPKQVIRKRIAYHIWMKAHEKTIPVPFTNIHEPSECFEGKSLAEKLLELTSSANKDIHLIRHFKYQWSSDPTEQRWAISVHKGVYNEVISLLQNLQRNMIDEFGSEVLKYFNQQQTHDYGRPRQSMIDDDEDNWFEEDEEDKEKDVLEEGFELFLAPSDDHSVASWGTGNTKYTELLQRTTQTTINSSLTPDEKVTESELQQRKGELEKELTSRGCLNGSQINQIIGGKEPFSFISKHIRYKDWNLLEEVDIILAIHERMKNRATGAINLNNDNDE